MIILVGASASGKTEAAKILASDYAIKKVVTHTTRDMRINESDGVDYHFTDREVFLKLKDQDFFVETTLYNNNFYGTSRKELSDDKVLIVDPNGLEVFRDLHDKNIVSFLLIADDDTRYNRMIERGDSIENAKKRIENDTKKFHPDVVGKVDYIIDSEHLSLKEMTEKIYDIYLNHLNKSVL